MEWGQQMKRHQTNMIDSTYQNPRYTNERNRKKTLVLDINDSSHTHLGSGTEFTVDLFEPLIIDKHSEIYLDNFITYNCNLSDTHAHSAFCLKINEFNLNSNVASNDDNQTIFNSIVIPNENNDVNNYFGTVIHKGKKFNYLCDINPTTISKISGKITDLAGDSIFHGSLSDTSQTYFISGVTSSGTWTVSSGQKGFIPKGTTFTILSGAGSDGPVTCTTVAGIGKDSDIIYFTTTGNITDANYQATVASSPTITISFTGLTETLTITSSTTSLDKENGRFMAEFSIISRE